MRTKVLIFLEKDLHNGQARAELFGEACGRIGLFIREPAVKGADKGIHVKMNAEGGGGTVGGAGGKLTLKNGCEDGLEVFTKRILPLDLEHLAVKGLLTVKVIAQSADQLPMGDDLAVGQGLQKLGIKDPVNEIVLVTEMIVKALSVHLALVAYVADVDLSKGNVCHQLL